MSVSEQTKFTAWKSYLSFTLGYFSNLQESNNRNVQGLCLDDGFQTLFHVAG